MSSTWETGLMGKVLLDGFSVGRRFSGLISSHTNEDVTSIGPSPSKITYSFEGVGPIPLTLWQYVLVDLRSPSSGSSFFCYLQQGSNGAYPNPSNGPLLLNKKWSPLFY